MTLRRFLQCYRGSRDTTFVTHYKAVYGIASLNDTYMTSLRHLLSYTLRCYFYVEMFIKLVIGFRETLFKSIAKDTIQISIRTEIITKRYLTDHTCYECMQIYFMATITCLKHKHLKPSPMLKHLIKHEEQIIHVLKTNTLNTSHYAFIGNSYIHLRINNTRICMYRVVDGRHFYYQN